MAKKAKFKVGDIVMLSKTSQYYNEDGDEYNPTNCYGRIASVFKSTGSIYVNWDNGKYNSYTAEDLEYPAGTETNDTLTVDKEFVMHAYESACSSWKAKIEHKFPELFPKQKFATLTTQTPGTSTLYYITESGTYKSLEYNIALIDGVAGIKDVPKEARYKGIYVSDRYDSLDLEVVKLGDGYAILFKLKD